MRSALLLSLPAVLEAKALAMEGGGWRAQVSDAGLISGLLSFAAKQRGTAATLEDTGLLEDFDQIATNSGSSWFFSSLAYSPSYRTLIEGMARNPSSAATQHNAGYTKPWLQATNVDLEKFSLREDLARYIAKMVLGNGDEEFLFMAWYFLTAETSWNYFVEVILQSTAGLGDETLGSAVNAFAKGKTWIAANTVVVPDSRIVRLYQDSDEYPRVNYEATSASGALPELLPAKFSVALGAGEAAPAPHSYLPESAFGDVSLKFNAVVDVLAKPHATSAPMDSRDFAEGSLTEGVGQLPVKRVVSTSSAFAGIAPVLGLLVDEGLAILDADLTPWVSNAADGRAFQAAEELVAGLPGIYGHGKETVQSLADLQVHGLIDGGYTDNTALGAAVGAGADEVTVVLNSNATNFNFDMELLFKGGPAPVNPGASAEIYPVFDSAIGDFQSFHQLTLPSSAFLKQIAVGSFKATTASNAYFGIEAGREVTVNVVNLCSFNNIVAYGKVSFENYDDLVQEIIMAINDESNFDLVSKTLLPMFSGAARDERAVVV